MREKEVLLVTERRHREREVMGQKEGRKREREIEVTGEREREHLSQNNYNF